MEQHLKEGIVFSVTPIPALPDFCQVAVQVDGEAEVFSVRETDIHGGALQPGDRVSVSFDSMEFLGEEGLRENIRIEKW